MGRAATGGVRKIRCAGGIVRYQPRIRKEAIGTGRLYDTLEEALQQLKVAVEIEAADKAEQPATAKVLVTTRTGAELYFKPRRDAGNRRDLENEESIFRTYFGALVIDFEAQKKDPMVQVHEDVFDHIDAPMHRVTFTVVQEHVNKIAITEAKAAITIGRIAGQNKQVVLRDTGKRRAVKTIKNAIGVAKRIWEKALAHTETTKVQSNPWKNRQLEIPTEKAEVVEHDCWTYLTLAEIEKVLAALPYDDNIKPTKDPKKKLRALRKRARQAMMRAFFVTAIYVGLRKGELCGLRWRHVLFGQREVSGVFLGHAPRIEVRYSYNGPPKTKKARREPHMLPVVRQALLTWKEESDDLKKSTGRIPSLDDLVFESDHGGCYSTGWDGGWASRDYYKNRGTPNEKKIHVQGLRERLGIRKEVTFHCATRHTCASMLMMGGFGLAPKPLEQVMGILGHSDITVTQRYAKLVPSMLDREVAELYTFEVPPHAVGDDD